MGRFPRAWQDRRAVLGGFGETARRAIRGYRDSLRAGLPLGRRPELVGGGLIRSAGGWAEVRALRRQKEPLAGDPRILGSGAFVDGLLREAEARQRTAWRRPPTPRDIAALLARTCQRERVALEELQRGGRRGPLSAVRAALARQFVVELGLSLAQAARHLGVSTAAISKILRKQERGVS